MKNRIFGKITSIKIEGITKKYGQTTALHDFNMEIEGGELLILIGPSGSGKTTALKAINRLIEPDQGKIYINGQDTMGFDPVQLRRNIGYVIQQIGLFPHLNIGDNIGLVSRIEKWSREKIDKRVGELLSLVDLPQDHARRFPHQLSGGQQQRVGLARSLVMDPYLLLMDEPFGALDPILRKQLQTEFLKIRQELGKTIVFVTHDIEEAFRLGDRIAIMDKARLIQAAKPNQLILNPKNSFVSDLVSSHKKFLHMDNLIVKDLMIPLEEKYIFNHDQTTEEATGQMRKQGTEMAVVVKNNRFEGITDLNQICHIKGKILGQVLKPVDRFSPDRCLSEAISELKKKDSTLAVVTDGNNPVGIITTDKLLLELV
ncbi:MAG: ABC transporter ATP-binding protein [Actinomycetota bacterium]